MKKFKRYFKVIRLCYLGLNQGYSVEIIKSHKKIVLKSDTEALVVDYSRNANKRYTFFDTLNLNTAIDFMIKNKRC